MTEWIIGIVERMGYGGVALLTALENVFPPIPSEVIMPLAGFTAARGEMTLVGAIVAGSAGSLVGQLPWYWAGRWLGKERFRRWVERHGRRLALETKDVDRAQSWFDRHGAWAIFLGRLVPGVRTYVSAPAGFACYPFWRFMLWTTLGTVLWTAALTAAGLLLGENYHKVRGYTKPVSTSVGAAFALLVAWWFWRRRRGR